MISKYPPILWVDVFLKLALVGLLVFGAFSGLQQFEGKGFLWRLITYPVAILVLPVAWRVWRGQSTYPFVADILITLPLLIDTLGNTLDLYDTVEWWDDANHLVNWALLSGGFGSLVARLRYGFGVTGGLVVGFGATTAILWEGAEYIAFIRVSPELETAYIDTLGDLTLGLLGSVASGAITGWVACRPQSQSDP